MMLIPWAAIRSPDTAKRHQCGAAAASTRMRLVCALPVLVIGLKLSNRPARLERHAAWAVTYSDHNIKRLIKISKINWPLI